MKILHINYSDTSGGAAIAAYRHSQAMQKVGIESSMLVMTKYSGSEWVKVYHRIILSRIIYKVIDRVANMLYNFYATWSDNTPGYDLSKDKSVNEADVIFIHWIGAHMLSLNSLEHILQLGKPVYWFMHDMWAFTGGCHYSFSCDKYMTHCAQCPLAHNRQGSKKERDTAFRQFERKRRMLSPYKNLYFIAPSQWLADCCKRSALFGDHEVHLLRNVIDTDLFSPRDKIEARKRLGLPINRKLILFGADNVSSPYKGWSFLRQALTFQNMVDCECVVYGASDVDIAKELTMSVYQLGRITNVDRMIDVYSACDVFVAPSIAENYANVIIEAMACGTPVVGFNVGGIPNQISHKSSGYLANPNDVKDLNNGIRYILSLPTLQYKEMQNVARKYVIENCSFEAYKSQLQNIMHIDNIDATLS